MHAQTHAAGTSVPARPNKDPTAPCAAAPAYLQQPPLEGGTPQQVVAVGGKVDRPIGLHCGEPKERGGRGGVDGVHGPAGPSQKALSPQRRRSQRMYTRPPTCGALPRQHCGLTGCTCPPNPAPLPIAPPTPGATQEPCAARSPPAMRCSGSVTSRLYSPASLVSSWQGRPSAATASYTCMAAAAGGGQHTGARGSVSML